MSTNYSIKSQYVIPIDLTWPNQSYDHMIGVTWSLGPTKMIVLLCYVVPSDQIVPFVSNSFLTYQAIDKSSHRTINGSPGIVPNDCMIFPYYHIGPNCPSGPIIILDSNVTLGSITHLVQLIIIPSGQIIALGPIIILDSFISLSSIIHRMQPFYATALNVIGPIWSIIRPLS